MESRRQFIKKAALLAGAGAAFNWLPESIQRALAIQAPAGSTFLDAEHIVFLMQENRSFDHCFGTLKGVRGFNDPRAFKLPNGLPVWVQSNKTDEHFVPFHLDIVNSKSTWMKSLPHSWKDMVAARNNGKMDNWLEAKAPTNTDYKQMPLTMGYYNRADIPFYYAFADAFTVCDQHFCSSLTGTSANRSYFWSGTIRENAHNPKSVARVNNGQINYQNLLWKTYPERLEEAGISWKVYQNELSISVGFNQDEENCLANFTDNNLEFHKQYGVRFHPAHRRYMEKNLAQLTDDLSALKNHKDGSKDRKKIAQLRQDIKHFSEENFEKQSEFLKAIHRNAFVTNIGDPKYHQIEKLTYKDGFRKQEVQVPSGDIFYQFRKDVKEKKLPTVSWLVAPCQFSDHPDSPWYGAWYVSEALDILIQDPEVWKKTIFILTYDENDGYFDHVPPFVPPLTSKPDTGKAADGINTDEEYVSTGQEQGKNQTPNNEPESPIGLGFRVPLIIASPWTKGGWVNSEVFDHTSSLQFLEYFLLKKTGKEIKETNISDWRRLICGNFVSVFRKIDNTSSNQLKPLNRDQYVERIYSARFKKLPSDFVKIPTQALAENNRFELSKFFPKQEKGVKPACALPYVMDVNALLDETAFKINFDVKASLIPINKPLGVPFYVMAHMGYGDQNTSGRVWNFAVKELVPFQYEWQREQVKGDIIGLDLHGPNGFFRSFNCHKSNRHAISINQTGVVCNPVLQIEKETENFTYTFKDRAYGAFEPFTLNKEFKGLKTLDFTKSYGWYDIEIRCPQDPDFCYLFAGHMETGLPSHTDPLMGNIELF